MLWSVREALGLLHTVEDRSVLFDRAVRVLCDVCDFDRALLFRVDGSTVRLERIHVPGDPRLETEVMRIGAEDPPRLTHMLVETEMVRQRGPVLVRDAGNDPRTHKPLIVAGAVDSYVAAPIMPDGDVIGFLHADRQMGVPLDELDRDALFAFAEALGVMIARLTLHERLRTQQEQLRRMARQAEEVADGLARADLKMALEPVRVEASGALSVLPPEQPGATSQLTRREFEVLKLLAEGMSNAAIAERLVVSPATVKSHVHRVLVKLGARNRAEATSRYLRMTSGPSAAA